MRLRKIICLMCFLFLFLSAPSRGAEIGDCVCTEGYGCSIFRGYDSYNMEIWEHCTSCPSSGNVSSSKKTSNTKSLSVKDRAYVMSRINNLTRQNTVKHLWSAEARGAFYNILRNNPDLTEKLFKALEVYEKLKAAEDKYSKYLDTIQDRTRFENEYRHYKGANAATLITSYGVLGIVAEICAKDPALDSVRQILEDIIPQDT